MGLPPTSPRFKFMHTHPVGTSSNLAVPRRPPRQPPSPSTRSRSLELLDQQDEEQKSISSVIVQRPPLPRPRSRSLDGLLDEDTKNGEEQDKMKQEESRECSQTSSEEDKIISSSEDSQKEPNIETVESKNLNSVPKLTIDTVESKSKMKDIRSLDRNENHKEAPPMRPPKPNRRSSSEGQSSACLNRQCMNQEVPVEEQSKTVQGGNENNDYDNDDDRSTMLLKVSRSCGAGLDSDGSVSSSEYSGHRVQAKEPGSLLSLPTGAEPKRKRNFMDKCVNKVRSFMKK
ncbi:hypothetical protein P5V15_010658 [Pogonomyrmex californicus]